MFNAKIILLLLFVFGWLLYTTRILDVPPGINGDEATLGYNAALISKTLRDENGSLLPLFVSTHEGKDWKQPVSIYATSLAFSIFGPSYFTLRSVSVFFVLVSALLIFILLKELLDSRFAILGSLIFMTIPAVIIQSHLALENIAPIPFVTFWILMLVRYQKNGNEKYLFLSAISLGLSLYSYQAMRIIAPVFISLTILYLILLSDSFFRKRWIKPVTIFILGVLPFVLFFLVVRKEYPGALGAHNRPSFPQSYQEFILPYLSSYDLSFLFIQGDSTLYHSTGKHGIFLLASLPLFISGVYGCIKGKGLILRLILIAFFTAPFFFGLVGSVHRGSRLLAILPLYTIIATIGLKGFLEVNAKNLRAGILILISTLMLVNFLDFTVDFWFKYPHRVKAIFPSNVHITFETFYKKSKDLGKKSLIQHDLYENRKYDAKFFEKVYFPQGLQTWRVGDNLEPGSMVLISAHNLPIAERLGAKKIETELTDPILVAKDF